MIRVGIRIQVGIKARVEAQQGLVGVSIGVWGRVQGN